MTIDKQKPWRPYLTVCSALLIAGCDHQMQGASIYAAVAACEKNGGLAYAYSYNNHAMGLTVVCNDFSKKKHVGRISDVDG